MDKTDLRNLKERYLIWLYKTTKEALDKVERKFTQLALDRFILQKLIQLDKHKQVQKFIAEFKIYIQNKEKDALALKYKDRQLKPDYHFLVLKLRAIEKAIVKKLGSNTLKKIKSLYEKEMIERILKSNEHK